MGTTPSTLNAAHGEGHFAKVLGFRELVVYGLCYVAPVAPWGTFAYVYDLSGGAAVLAYAIGIVCMYFTANSYAQICGEVSGPGSVYSYARKAMGNAAGFLAGWLVLLDYLLIPALCYVLAAVALNAFIPAVPRWVWVLICAGFTLGINWYGIVITARATLVFLVGQLVAAAIYVVWVLAATGGSLAAKFPLDALWSTGTTPHGLFAATSISVLIFIGFDAITTLTAEVRPDQKHLVGRSIVTVLLIIGGISILLAWVMAGLAHGFKFSDLGTGVYDMTAAKVSPIAGVATAWTLAFVSGIAITPPMMVAVARVLYAMSHEGQLPAFLNRLHPKYRVPERALLVASFIAVVVALSFMQQPDALTSIVNFGALAAYATVHVSVIALLYRKQRSGRWLSHLVMPVLGIAVILTVMSQMTSAALILGASWFAAGAAYYLWLRKFRRAATESVIESL